MDVKQWKNDNLSDNRCEPTDNGIQQHFNEGFQSRLHQMTPDVDKNKTM